MGCSSGKAIRIHDGTLKASVQVLDEVFDTLELWYRWGSNMARETVYSTHEIRAGLLHNM